MANRIFCVPSERLYLGQSDVMARNVPMNNAEVGFARHRVGQQLPECEEEEFDGEAEPAAVTKVLQAPQLPPLTDHSARWVLSQTFRGP